MRFVFVSVNTVRACVKQFAGNNFIDKFQSDFQKIHSIETAFLKELSDILMAADSGQYTALIFT